MSVVLDRLYHLHWVKSDLARSAQPYLGFYAAFLRPHGFRSIINLRGPNPEFGWWRQEKRVAEALGHMVADVDDVHARPGNELEVELNRR